MGLPRGTFWYCFFFTVAAGMLWTLLLAQNSSKHFTFYSLSKNKLPTFTLISPVFFVQHIHIHKHQKTRPGHRAAHLLCVIHSNYIMYSPALAHSPTFNQAWPWRPPDRTLPGLSLALWWPFEHTGYMLVGGGGFTGFAHRLWGWCDLINFLAPH